MLIQKEVSYICECGYCGKELFTGEWSQKCSKCQKYIRQYKIKYNPKNVGKKDFVNVAYPELERYSRSMGVPPADIEKYQKMYPGSEYNSNGDLRIKNYTHREFERKRRGMVDLGNRR